MALALLTGLFLAIQSVLGLIAFSGLFPVYIHLLVFGWLTQLVFGVVFWMFPKYSNEKPRGNEALGWWTYASLNIGLISRAIAQPIQSIQPNPVTGWILVASAGLQLFAGLTFVVNSWDRVRVK